MVQRWSQSQGVRRGSSVPTEIASSLDRVFVNIGVTMSRLPGWSRSRRGSVAPVAMSYGERRGIVRLAPTVRSDLDLQNSLAASCTDLEQRSA